MKLTIHNNRSNTIVRKSDFISKDGSVHTFSGSGTITGYLSYDPRFYAHKDGSYKCIFKLGVIYHAGCAEIQPADGPVQMEQFISCRQWPSSPCRQLHKGSLVTVQYAVRTDSYRDKSGHPVKRTFLDVCSIQVHQPVQKIAAKA